MKRINIAAASILFIVSLVLYIRTLAPSLLYGDSAEFQTIAYTLGIGHPTGYPVYILLAKLFTFLPVGEIAYRVNLFSAFCAALVIGLVYHIIRELGGKTIPSVCGALTLALVPLFWKHATIAEVYAPAAACLAIILCTILRWREIKTPRWIFFAGLFGGLSLGIHTMVAISGISILLYLALSARQRRDWSQALLGMVIGVIIFFTSFLILDSINSPAGYYNTVVRPSLSVWNLSAMNFDSPFERFTFLYFPPQFKGQFLNVPVGKVITRWEDFTRAASWTLLPALIGWIALFIPRKDTPSRWREAVLLIVAFLTFMAFAGTYNIYDFQVYYIPAFVILAILVGLGISAILDLFPFFPKLPRFVPFLLGILILALGLFPSLAIVTSSWHDRIPPGLESWERSFFVSPYMRKREAEQIVNRIEDNAIVFTDWDSAYNFYYVAHILQGRTDMSFHETFPQEGVTKFADSAIAYIEANIDTRPIYFSERPNQLAGQYKLIRAGSGLFRLERK